MRLSLDDIDEVGLTRTFSEPVEGFDELLQLQQQQIRFLAPIEGEIAVQRSGKDVRLTGRFNSCLSMECSRCLAIYQQPVEGTFDLAGVVGATTADDDSELDVELDEASLDELRLMDDEIDVSALVQEQVLLALPLQPVCDEACRGLCAICGCDLNHQSCNCDQQPKGGPFSVLKDFKIND